MSKSVDQTNKTCTKCKKGKYIETSLQDDWHGVLHCNKCGHEVKRWLTIKSGYNTNMNKPISAKGYEIRNIRLNPRTLTLHADLYKDNVLTCCATLEYIKQKLESQLITPNVA